MVVLNSSLRPSRLILIVCFLQSFSVASDITSSKNRESVNKEVETESGILGLSPFNLSRVKKGIRGIDEQTNYSGIPLTNLTSVRLPQRRDLQEEIDDYNVREDEQNVEDCDDDSDLDEEENLNYYEDDSEFGKDELIKLVTKLEEEAQAEERSSSLPFVWDWSTEHSNNGAVLNRKNNHEGDYNNDRIHAGGKNLSFAANKMHLPEDLGDIPEDIVDEVTAGVEEYLKLSEPTGIDDIGFANHTETRQFPIYLFQGQYTPEPRLNPFIEGAMRNMARELRQDVMDPVYFRVLPRGRVESRPKPTVKQNKRRKRAAQTSNRFLDKFKKSLRRVILPGKKRVAGKRRRIRNKLKKIPGRFRRKKPNANKNNKNKNRRKNVRNKNNRRRKRPVKNRTKLTFHKKNKKKKKPKNKLKNRRQKRKTSRNVGGGRVEGLSKIACDGDAEMQVFGNYTLIRSHMKLGPVELSMQFKTRRGLRRTGATMPAIKMHTVTRLNMDGSEMIDFLLDRPHPESIKVRGNLFPLAQRIARNIFARLFVPTSFLTSRLREKAALALLSKPKG